MKYYGVFDDAEGWRKVRTRLWRLRNADHLKAYEKAKRETKGDELRARSRAWAAANREAANARSKAWRQVEANRKRKTARVRADRAVNPEKYRAAERRKYHAKVHVYTAKHNAREKRVRQATPPWVDRAAIRQVYEVASMLGMQVDHIHPLKGENFCGLHVPWNLQLLTLEQNASKGNRLLDENVCCVG